MGCNRKLPRVCRDRDPLCTRPDRATQRKLLCTNTQSLAHHRIRSQRRAQSLPGVRIWWLMAALGAYSSLAYNDEMSTGMALRPLCSSPDIMSHSTPVSAEWGSRWWKDAVEEATQTFKMVAQAEPLREALDPEGEW